MKLNLTVKLMVSLICMSLLFYSIYVIAYSYTINSEGLMLPGQANATFAVATVQMAKAVPNEVIWTPKTLSVNNGMNGKPVYIAVDGIVYDMSKLAAWKGGVHKGIHAGTDATADFKNSPHAKSILKLAKIVGTYSPKEVTNLVVKKAAVVPVTPAKPVIQASAKQTDAVTSATLTTSKVKWTVASLKQYDGRNGKPAYISVNGVIYDVSGSKTWRNGSHNGTSAGQDVTKAFANSPHAKSLLASLPVVAKIGDAMTPLTMASGKGTPISSNKSKTNISKFEEEEDDDDEQDEDDEDDQEEDEDDSDHDD